MNYYRVTKHKKPRYQLYQPGFNKSNSCWLTGKWINLPKEEWEACKAAHEQMYKDIEKEKGTQHYRNKGTSIKKMTPAQRQAWKHFSGSATITVLQGENHDYVGLACINLAGEKISESSIKWIRKEGWLIPQIIEEFGKQINQQSKYGIPSDLIKEGDALDSWGCHMAQSRDYNSKMFDACLDSASSDHADLWSSFGGFSRKMAVQSIITLEEDIIRGHWRIHHGSPDRYFDPKERQEEYVRRRKALKDKLGDEFDSVYVASRASHNECAKANLGEKRISFSFVLPEFHEDGTFEPWGEKDVPVWRET